MHQASIPVRHNAWTELKKYSIICIRNDVVKSKFNEEVMIMSRNIKGGFLTLSGVVGIVGMIIAAMQNPATAWVTPPGRMIVSILENGVLIPTVLFLVLFIYGLYILLTEKKD